ncbi:DUF6776 family protein [sulfur-oxidizing endosymbiont of Gigantopelta aegis]|uniref:DUF6776 family protein n=1 Tax=sulfur-oxidizing endosymbiont of Gigantopelta aegis TaxID=2794934 RepID=UPI0018DD482C|nr:DUF6776 family protein [sulfur-oxidizing endosymbiont of Gigantopelta aegis]
MTHIIVHRTHPLHYYGIRLLLIILAIALLWGAFELGYMQSEEDIIEAKGGRKSLLVQQSVLKKKNTELNKEILHLERKYLLEQESCQLIQLGMSKDQQKIAALEKKLAFYKSIVSPSKTRESIYLQSLEIVPYTIALSDSEKKPGQAYQYQFTLAQKIKKRSYTKGFINIYIKGKQNNKSVKYSLLSLRVIPKQEKKDANKKGLKYSFKYFQEFSGIIYLPEGMIPQSVEIIIDSKKKKSIIELGDLEWSQTRGIKYVGQ